MLPHDDNEFQNDFNARMAKSNIVSTQLKQKRPMTVSMLPTQKHLQLEHLFLKRILHAKKEKVEN